ncbi:sigma factor-like helix-turn-helix DNA-binding protein [Micromonospora siamensis]|uniref:Two-component system, NarL family, response regulator DesR n=1 Tax=Micromonospora siamensis TaxID=299152 RepID=A0A1C5GSX9_9ACTN|nr:response regulator transcription factor [Micromonospora siamensis]SCG36895.1 two-component system, NarL family, response regulator DesR [Micromonospora siamensis]
MPKLFTVHARTRTHLLVRQAVAALPQVELVGSSGTAGEAVRVLGTLAPDALTVDVRLPDGDGIDLAVRLRDLRPQLRVVLFGPASDTLLRRAVAAGMPAYLPVHPEAGQVGTALRDCLAGRTSYPARFLAGALRRDPPARLSPREREVAALVGDGVPAAEVAVLLGISESAVRTYLARARAKTAHEGRHG